MRNTEAGKVNRRTTKPFSLTITGQSIDNLVTPCNRDAVGRPKGSKQKRKAEADLSTKRNTVKMDSEKRGDSDAATGNMTAFGVGQRHSGFGRQISVKDLLGRCNLRLRYNYCSCRPPIRLWRRTRGIQGFKISHRCGYRCLSMLRF